MAKQRRRPPREPAKPDKRSERKKPTPASKRSSKRAQVAKRAEPTTPEILARALVAAWRRGDAPALDVAMHLDGRARIALYRAVNKLVRSPAVRRDLTESEIAQLVVRAIELKLFVTGGEGKLSAFADE